MIFASESRFVSRFGPTAPVAPAALSVWHFPHRALKSALPEAGLVAVAAAFLCCLFVQTKAAMSATCCVVNRVKAGMTPPPCVI